MVVVAVVTVEPVVKEVSEVPRSTANHEIYDLLVLFPSFIFIESNDFLRIISTNLWWWWWWWSWSFSELREERR